MSSDECGASLQGVPVRRGGVQISTESLPDQVSNRPGVAGPSDRLEIEEQVNLRNESERLKTFDKWPVKFLTSSKMASAGFYYLKEGDKVRCAFCGIEIGDWKPGDDPMKCHARWASACQFLKKEPARNIFQQTDIEETSNRYNNDPGYDICGPYGLKLQNVEHQKLITQESKLLESPNYIKVVPPSFQQYVSYDARLLTYDSWPISFKVKPNVLSEAGFFYTGYGDQTICFHCGGGLIDWRDTDEPWVEHARHFSKCPFVVSLKGKAFVDEACGKKVEEELCTELKGLSCTRDLENVQTFARQNETAKSNEDKEGSSSTPSIGTLTGSSRTKADILLCKICFAEEIGAVFFPCGHMMACPKCALSLTLCAVCRKPVTGFIKAFLSM